MQLCANYLILVFESTTIHTPSLSPCFSLLPIKDTVVLALNQDYIEHNTQINLKPGDEIAVIPPISGG